MIIKEKVTKKAYFRWNKQDGWDWINKNYPEGVNANVKRVNGVGDWEASVDVEVDVEVNHVLVPISELEKIRNDAMNNQDWMGAVNSLDNLLDNAKKVK